MTKHELRQRYLKKRQSLSEAEFLQRNHALCERFFSGIDISFIKVIHVFLPLTEKHEPDTWLIIDRIRREFPLIRLSIPRVNETSNTLEHFFFEGLHQLKKNKWGILEPQQGIPTPLQKIDMVLVPLLAYDTTGHRLGYGKGYYDRFLAQCPSSTRAYGISFFPPEKQLPTHEADVRLNGCITPEGVYIF